jgi:hypothetical protein
MATALTAILVMESVRGTVWSTTDADSFFLS